MTQSNPVPAGGCGPAPETPFRVRVACAGTKAEAATVEGYTKEASVAETEDLPGGLRCCVRGRSEVA